MKIRNTILSFVVLSVMITFAGCKSNLPSTKADLPSAPRMSKNSTANDSKKRSKTSDAAKKSEQTESISGSSKTKGAEKKNTNIKSPLRAEKNDNHKLYAAIEKWYGTPYRIGGCSNEGIDCSCFVKTIYQEVYGVSLPRTAKDIPNEMSTVSRKDLKEGDVVFFRVKSQVVNHVGIYLKDDYFVHASTSQGVMVSSLNEKYWDNAYYMAGRHKDVK